MTRLTLLLALSVAACDSDSDPVIYSECKDLQGEPVGCPEDDDDEDDGGSDDGSDDDPGDSPIPGSPPEPTYDGWVTLRADIICAGGPEPENPWDNPPYYGLDFEGDNSEPFDGTAPCYHWDEYEKTVEAIVRRPDKQLHLELKTDGFEGSCDLEVTEEMLSDYLVIDVRPGDEHCETVVVLD